MENRLVPTKVAIGYGRANKIHSYTLPEVRTVGVVDTDPRKRLEARGLSFYTSLDDFFSKEGEKPEYYSVTNPDEYHFETVKKILENDKEANILVEKPVCMPSQTSEMLDLIEKYNKANIMVNENYKSSSVAKNVKELVQAFGLKKPEITVEFSQNYAQDIRDGRTANPVLGAFSLEYPHMMAVVGFFDGKRMKDIIKSELADAKLPDGAVVKKHGDTRLVCDTEDGTRVNYFSSLQGNMMTKIPRLKGIPKVDLNNRNERYRMIHIKDDPISVIGVFEPVTGMPRNRGLLYAYRNNNGKLEDNFSVVDNNMRASQVNAIKFFRNEITNPFDVKKAVEIVEDLGKAAAVAQS